ncbi:DUF3158 family protein [Azotobacter vinelandii]|uniref:DUF3158 family protein n=1 Tax=Azotobacter vinelandii TaxID=354 RepID=UPI00091D5EE3|nr:DUF3158 family protein [Azotobacter vinelandii]WKN23202.1 DUF3158 family protein [Azotobacter vinelandii]SFY08898.1 Protein of unknown function [Azotobacter vinelandii]
MSQSASQQTAFRPLQQAAFQGLQQSASLKGLLKPFKGKGELVQLAEQCQVLEAGLKQLTQDVLAQVRNHPFSLLPVRLVEQRSTQATVLLRWQHIQTRRMGVGIWADMIRTPRTPVPLLQDLLALEQQRITLNMQISIIHFIARQAADCAEKMGQAEAVVMGRLQQAMNQPQSFNQEKTV